MKNIKNLALLVLVMIIAFLSFRSPRIKEVPGATIIKTDTVMVTKIRYDTIEVEKPIYIYRTLDIPNPTLLVESNDSLNIYSDTLTYEGLVIHYELFVKGELKKFNIGYLDTRPEIIKTITNNIVVTNETLKYRNGIYLGFEIGGSQQFFNFGPKVTIQRNKWLYGYRYGLSDKSHNISIQRKLF